MLRIGASGLPRCTPSIRLPVLGYVLRRTGNGEDVADVIAEIFLVAWRRLEDAPAGNDARLWLFGVARRVLANYRRGERRRLQLADRLRADLSSRTTTGPGPGSGPEDAELAAAFRSLREEDRELLALEAWEDLDAGQIATVLGCSRNAVRVRLHRARQRLRTAIAVASTPATELPVPARGTGPPPSQAIARPPREPARARQHDRTRRPDTIVIKGDAT